MFVNCQDGFDESAPIALPTLKKIEYMEIRMKSQSKALSLGLWMLLVGSIAMAAPLSPRPAAHDEPDLVFGGSSKAMLMSPKAPLTSAPDPAGQTQRWSVETRDVNLANTFQRWAGQAGWKVRWDAAKHVMVEAPDSTTGTFEEAVEAQLASPGIAMSSYPLEVCFYPNTPPLARITRKGDQNLECK